MKRWILLPSIAVLLVALLFGAATLNAIWPASVSVDFEGYLPVIIADKPILPPATAVPRATATATATSTPTITSTPTATHANHNCHAD